MRCTKEKTYAAQNRKYTLHKTEIIIWRITESKASGRLIILHSLSPGLFEVHYNVSASSRFAARAIFQDDTKNSAFLKMSEKDLH